MKSPKPVGRLELTWTNKHLRLLAQEDGSYEWVEPSDHRVAEVRLLRDAGRVGEEDEGDGPENLLIRGDALHALLSLSALPEYQDKYAGKVRLVYIDPPFNTQQSFLQYDDALEHSVWLTMMRDRLLQTRDLLAPDGSVWVHLDDSESAYARVLLDEVFGRENFVATIVWEKTHTRENRHGHLGLPRLHPRLRPRQGVGGSPRVTCFRPSRRSWGVTAIRTMTRVGLGRRSLPMRKLKRAAEPSSSTTSRRPPAVSCGHPKAGAGCTPRIGSKRLVRDDRIWFGEDGANVPRREEVPLRSADRPRPDQYLASRRGGDHRNGKVGDRGPVSRARPLLDAKAGSAP